MLYRLMTHSFALFALSVLVAPAVSAIEPAEPQDEPADSHVAVAVPKPGLAPAALARNLARDEPAADEDEADDQPASEEDDSMKWFKSRRAELEKKLRRSERGEYDPRAESTYLVTTRESAGLTADAVRKVYREHKGQMQYCYNREVARRPAFKGKITFSCTVDARGLVASTRVVEDTIGSAVLRDCLESRIQSWAFPKPLNGATAEVELPTLFW